MRLDLVLPSESVDDDPRGIVDLAVAAERAGYGAVWLPDHLLPPGPFGGTYGGVHEPLTMLAAIASRTTTLKLGTSVVIAPLREPVLLAKQVATIDALAPGRVLLGLGTGWERAEFEALGLPFAGRGARTDAIVDLVRSLHATGRGPDGEWFAPVPRAPVPLVVGGMGERALLRAARVGDVWQAVGQDPEGFAAFRDRLDALAAAEGRSVAAGARIQRGDGESDDELAARIESWRAVDPDHLAVHGGPVA